MDETEDQKYAKHKASAAKRQAKIAAEGRDIPKLPAVQNPTRRKSAEKNLSKFLITYFPNAFPLAWSNDHKKAIKKIEQAILSGGLFALAMPRGSGKTTILERAILWAVLYGHHKYAMLVGANAEKAGESIDKIKLELENNELLLADFPEACIPARKVGGIANRCNGQTYQGEPTRIQWAKKYIVLASIKGAKCSGAVLKTGAIKSAVRGANHTRVDGTVVRPSLVLLDDPQTRESAKSVKQTDTREQIVAADVLGLAGPGETISALMACTVIEAEDLSDRMLNRTRNPEWQGERTKMLYAMPVNMTRWQEYRELQSDLLSRDAEPEHVQRELNAFYRKHRDEMDQGAQVAWEERKMKGDVSALQSAMNLFFRNQQAFASEYQNEPLILESGNVEEQSVEQIARRINQLERGRLPLQATHISTFIDVHQDLLYYGVAWWADDFTGGLLDYGTWPKQNSLQFTLRSANPTIRQVTKKRAILAAVRSALDSLFGELAAREFIRDDGLVMKIERIGIDANWGLAADTVYDAIRESEHRAILRPCHGEGIKATGTPMSQYKVADGETAGNHWIRKTGKRGVRYLKVDTNYWKSFLHNGLALSFEERHSISLFKAAPHVHRMFAEHCLVESRENRKHRGREVDEWENVKRLDNHFFDVGVGCCVIASELGCVLRSSPPPSSSGRKKREPKFAAI